MMTKKRIYITPDSESIPLSLAENCLQTVQTTSKIQTEDDGGELGAPQLTFSLADDLDLDVEEDDYYH